MIPTVDPCLPDLELRLPAGGRLVFVSDLHLTEGGPTNDFHAAGELVELVESLQAHPGEVILVLGGDVLDLLQVQAPREDQARRVLAGADAVVLGEALRALSRRPGATLVYVVGNHDSTIAWDRASRDRVVGQFGVRYVTLHAHVRVEGVDGGELRLVAEHGDALDRYNRRTDYFDPLDVPPGDHMVTEVVNRFEAATGRYPDLALDQIDNVRPALMIPWWIVSNFFYRFMGRVLRHFALPLVLLWIFLQALVGLLVAGNLERVAYLSNRAVGWIVSVLLADLVILCVLSTVLGRSFQRAAAAYGVPSPDEAEAETANRRAGIPALLAERDPLARVLVSGHTHEPGLVRLPDGKVAVDAGCWVRGLVPVHARFSLPPVFVPAYPCNWVDVQAVPDGIEITLWERRLAVARRLHPIEWLIARRPLPSDHPEPSHVVARTVLPTLASPARAPEARGGRAAG